MVERTNSDVERALEAFGGSTLKYRSFGTFALKPNAAAVPPGLVPQDDSDYDPFAAVPPSSVAPPQQHLPAARAADAAGSHAGALYPLLGAAVPEASSVSVGPTLESSASRSAALSRSAPDYQDRDEAPPPSTYVPRQTRPATAYVPPTAPAPIVEPLAPSFAPMPEPAVEPVIERRMRPPVEQPPPPPPPVRSVVSTPVAERGWVPPPPTPEPPPPPRPPVVVAPPPPPPPAPPPPQPMMARTPEPAPPPRPARAPRAEPPAAALPITTLAAHLEDPEAAVDIAPRIHLAEALFAGSRAPETRAVAGPGAHEPRSAGTEAADHRSLVEMFRVLSGAPDPARRPAVALGRNMDEEPGLFRRL